MVDQLSPSSRCMTTLLTAYESPCSTSDLTFMCLLPLRLKLCVLHQLCARIPNELGSIWTYFLTFRCVNIFGHIFTVNVLTHQTSFNRSFLTDGTLSINFYGPNCHLKKIFFHFIEILLQTI